MELLELLATYLTVEGWFVRDGQRLISRLDSTSWDLGGSPLAVAGAVVQEDFCLLVPSAAAYAWSPQCYASRLAGD